MRFRDGCGARRGARTTQPIRMIGWVDPIEVAEAVGAAMRIAAVRGGSETGRTYAWLVGDRRGMGYLRPLPLSAATGLYISCWRAMSASARAT
jgi:hypothetical protein